MRIFGEMGEKYWPEFQDDTANRKVVATNNDKEKGIFRQMTVEPTAMTFSFESTKGVDINSIETDETLATLFKGVQAICDEFAINEIERAGIRFTIMSSIKNGNPSLEPLFGVLIDTQLVNAVTTKLGGIKDYGLSFDGEATDKISYHCHFGPYKNIESKKYFTATTAKKMEEEGAPLNLIFDVDLFESKFAMTVNANKWSKTPTLKAKQLAEEVVAYLSERL